jgi:hypothetical protein
VRSPRTAELIAEPLLGLLSIAERALIVRARSIRGTDPGVGKAPRPGDPPTIATGGALVDDIERLLAAIEPYRNSLRDRIHDRPTDDDLPF